MPSELVSMFWVRTNGKDTVVHCLMKLLWVFKYILHYVMHGLLMWTVETSLVKLTVSTPWIYYLNLLLFKGTIIKVPYLYLRHQYFRVIILKYIWYSLLSFFFLAFLFLNKKGKENKDGKSRYVFQGIL